MTTSRFVQAIGRMFSFLTDIMNEFMDIFESNPWFFSLIVAPVIVSVIIFGVSISHNLVKKSSSGGGER